MSATSSATIQVGYNNVMSSGTGGTLTDAFSDSISCSFQSGTAANQIDTTWSAKATLSTATATFIASALAGPGSGTTAFVRVRKIWIHNLATNETGTNTLVFAPGGTHPWLAPFVSGGSSTTAGITIPPGGAILIVAPLTTAFQVGSGSADQFTLTSVGSVPYIIAFEGASA